MKIEKSSARWHSVVYGRVVWQTTYRIIRRKFCDIISQLGERNNIIFNTGTVVHVGVGAVFVLSVSGMQ